MKKYLSRLLSLLLALVLLVAPASALSVSQALEILEGIYYYDIPEQAYQAETVEELIQLLGDPYTDYMTEEEYRALLKALEGDSGLVGIGVSIQYTERGILVMDTIAGGSAQESGFLPGDLIVAVDGASCVPADPTVADWLTGPEGSQVAVTILRGGETSTYTLTRRPIVIPNTEIQILDGGIGLIQCNSFGQDTGVEFARLVRENDSKVNLWLLDLRGNGGGYTEAATDLISALVGPGAYAYFEDGSGAVTYLPGKQAIATVKPVMLLVDGNSASASELVSANIRDLGRGISVGGRTFGKGVAQAVLDETNLPDYFDGDGMKVTSSRFYSGGLNTTDKIGVIPTLLVDDAYTAAVTLALCGSKEDARLALVLGGSACYVDPETDANTLAALLAALPPQASVFYRGTGAFDEVSVAQAAENLGVSYQSRWFTDVADSPYARAINALGTYGLINGTGGGKFSPDSKLTRAQLCLMLARTLNLTGSAVGKFSDVPVDAPYAGAVNAVAALGLVDGTGGGKFSPDAPLTQEQFLTIMGRLARNLNLIIDDYGDWVEADPNHLYEFQHTMLSPFSDWARSSMAVLTWGLEDALGGSVDMLYAPLDQLSPKQTVLRGEAAAGLYEVLSGLGILL